RSVLCKRNPLSQVCSRQVFVQAVEDRLFLSPVAPVSPQNLNGFGDCALVLLEPANQRAYRDILGRPREGPPQPEPRDCVARLLTLRIPPDLLSSRLREGGRIQGIPTKQAHEPRIRGLSFLGLRTLVAQKAIICTIA